MIKVIIEEDGKVIKEINGSAVFGVVTEPVDKEAMGADSTSFGIGLSNPSRAAGAMASSAGSILRDLQPNIFKRRDLSFEFVEVFVDALEGIGVLTESALKESSISPLGGSDTKKHWWQRK